LKLDLKCETCGESHIACLDFHHIDPSKKAFKISHSIRSYCKERILAEIAKCFARTVIENTIGKKDVYPVPDWRLGVRRDRNPYRILWCGAWTLPNA